jgi:DNA-directed RNA polymerase specialized sigma24 family protein
VGPRDELYVGAVVSALDARDPSVLRGYEPLVRSTALLIVSQLADRVDPEDGLEDVMQLLRVKVWQALRYYGIERMPRQDGESASRTRDRWVFMCLMNLKKDIIKRKRDAPLMIEDLAPAQLGFHRERLGPRDRFEGKYLAQSHDDVYGGVDEPVPLVPNTLTELEQQVMVLLYRDYTHREIAQRLDASKGEVSSAVRALRSKLADWRPAPAEAAAAGVAA